MTQMSLAHSCPVWQGAPGPPAAGRGRTAGWALAAPASRAGIAIAARAKLKMKVATVENCIMLMDIAL